MTYSQKIYLAMIQIAEEQNILIWGEVLRLLNE
jgi:hypothetical protein